MDTRRDFLKKAALLSGGAGLLGMLPPSIQKALAIDPEKGTTFLDAEHVVILMQENRSFDHSFGTLQGVRGFNDPRAMVQPNQNKVWLQTNEKAETYAPFRLNIRDTKATWMSALPHSWENQVDALNQGRMDGWLESKKSGNNAYKEMPLTMGFYNREDIPFYYAFADAFTVCDQNFCSSLTGTTPNRLYLWSGTIREKQDFQSKANVHNGDVTYQKEASWTTFPERLEDAGITWRIYQNELSVEVGFEGDEEEWLGNFTNNPLEWMKQYHVWYAEGFRKFLPVALEKLPEQIKTLETRLEELKKTGSDTTEVQKQLNRAKNELKMAVYCRDHYPPENFEKLPQKEQNLHQKAFTTNRNDPDYHQITWINYQDEGTERRMALPKGDVLHQFRQDVTNGKLPTVSYLVAPENFSDHPGAPWYGAWYLSETLDILTQNPEVWKKTVFILCYDENDGYFDHVTPFFPSRPGQPETGAVSKGIDTSHEMVNRKHELQRVRANPEKVSRDGPIGLGFRVPLVVASPWSRGGYVNSQVFDHTSIVQFLEVFLSHKTSKTIREENITTWRRTVCGDLTSVFRPFNGEPIALPKPVERQSFVESIHKAQFKKLPSDFRLLDAAEIQRINTAPQASGLMPGQEKGVRPSNPLPYELYADGVATRTTFELSLAAGNSVFGKKSAGAVFLVYLYGKTYQVRSYTVAPGDHLNATFPATLFDDGNYHLAVYGPNGFYREFKAGVGPGPASGLQYEMAEGKPTGAILLSVVNPTTRPVTVRINSHGYNIPPQSNIIPASETIRLTLRSSDGWYDLSLVADENNQTRYAGRVETGKTGSTDPVMGRTV